MILVTGILILSSSQSLLISIGKWYQVVERFSSRNLQDQSPCLVLPSKFLSGTNTTRSPAKDGIYNDYEDLVSCYQRWMCCVCTSPLLVEINSDACGTISFFEWCDRFRGYHHKLTQERYTREVFNEIFNQRPRSSETPSGRPRRCFLVQSLSTTFSPSFIQQRCRQMNWKH
jgi:hypothetical protein